MKKRRYSLVLPQVLFDDVVRVAGERNCKIIDLLKQFIKIGLLVAEADKDLKIFVRKGEEEREITLL